jgi:hypothetical protein
MCPIFLPSVRPPFGTIEDRLSVYDCCHARGGGFMQTCSGDVQDPVGDDQRHPGGGDKQLLENSCCKR